MALLLSYTSRSGGPVLLHPPPHLPWLPPSPRCRVAHKSTRQLVDLFIPYERSGLRNIHDRLNYGAPYELGEARDLIENVKPEVCSVRPEISEFFFFCTRTFLATVTKYPARRPIKADSYAVRFRASGFYFSI